MNLLYLCALCMSVMLHLRPAGSSEIVVVYPRVTNQIEQIVYPDNLDSTFIFGHVKPAGGELRINGKRIRQTSKGAFLAFLPVKKHSGTKSWNLVFTSADAAVAAVTVPYLFQKDLPRAAADTMPSVTFPRVLRVAEDNAHTRTAPAGSYHLFPVKGTRLLAVGRRDNFFEFHLTGPMTGFIESRFASLEQDSSIEPARVGNGRYQVTEDSSICRFFVSRSIPWSADLSSDGSALNIVLYDSRLEVDRFRYATGGMIRDVEWTQEPEAVRLRFRLAQPAARGYDIAIADDSLTVILREPFGKANRTLRDKVIVVDAGHGGSADGSIGPLGTREKDVTLRWAKLLADELRQKHAIPIMTRDDDSDVPLHERVAIAHRHGADMLVSLHANALPDGVNPFLRRGTGTYFYQKLSHEAAMVLHRHLLHATELADDGIWEANFAVIRPTAFPSVLLEAAYIMHPLEEEMLMSDDFLRRLAKGVVKGLGEYFKR